MYCIINNRGQTTSGPHRQLPSPLSIHYNHRCLKVKNSLQCSYSAKFLLMQLHRMFQSVGRILNWLYYTWNPLCTNIHVDVNVKRHECHQVAFRNTENFYSVLLIEMFTIPLFSQMTYKCSALAFSFNLVLNSRY